jgi:predicted nuclease of predicted toxin-antitoxin system
VKLLFDENLSRKLVQHLADLFPHSAQVVPLGLAESSDRVVFEYAKNGGFVVVTTDADFFELATRLGPPPKIVWLRRWAHPTRDAEALLRRNAIRLAEFEREPGSGILILDRDS